MDSLNIKPERTITLKERPKGKGTTAYWMSRDQRAEDNWALLAAWDRAFIKRNPLIVFFCLVNDFSGASARQYEFMIAGLVEIEKNLAARKIPFYVIKGSPEKAVPDFIRKQNITELFTDFDPLKIKRKWKSETVKNIGITVMETDTHNIVPCRIASEKSEFGAYTFRPRLKKRLPEFLDEFPSPETFPYNETISVNRIDWKEIRIFAGIPSSTPGYGEIIPGETAANKMLVRFIDHRLESYAERRNDPNYAGQSCLSPYIHFGQISAQRIAIEVIKGQKNYSQEEAFLEELIVRKELSDNFCYYNENYDNFQGFPGWCRATLDIHRGDRREYVYKTEQLENSLTHDQLWNAAQKQMVSTGKMHGYMRMYWAKKILEWTESPEQAIETAIYLNDRYELDGRDPNGYAGIAWSIGGVHDRPWKEREIFGKIRYMSYNGCAKKFDTDLFVDKYNK